MTPTFDHRVPGTLPSAWDAALAAAPALELPGPAARVVVLAAHPDDESLGVGGLVARCTAAGADVRVVVATDGRFSHPQSRSHSPERLAEMRREEATAAAHAVGVVDPPVFLDLPDGSLTLDPDRLADALAPHLADATHVLTPWEQDGHPDHEVCARVTRQVLAGRRDVVHWQYPIWAWHWDDPANPALPLVRVHSVPLDAEARCRKDEAIACHRSQYLSLSAEPGDEPVLMAHVLAHFARDTEYLLVDAPTTDPRYFEALYEGADDPWGLADRFYERRKRSIILASLPRQRFRRVFEPGCATGLLTEELAQRSDEVVAWDVVSAAVRRTADRLADAGNVSVASRGIPSDWPDGVFDLIVLSEVGYYSPDLGLLKRRLDGSLADDGVLLACHWRHRAPDHSQTAEAVHAAIGTGLYQVAVHVEDDFLLDVWSRSPLSVARETGVVA